MNARIAIATLSMTILLAGCATPPQRPVDVTPQTLSPSAGKIGVVMTPLPKVDTHLPGAGCLLCMAAASVANSSLTDYSHTLSYEDLSSLKGMTADLVGKKNPNVVVIDQPLNLSTLPDAKSKGPNIARKDFSSLKQKYNVDKLLVIDIQEVGFVRTYSSYFPTSDPKGELVGTGYIVDLNTNTYEWYLPIRVEISSDGKWNEPPKFPGLTNAYFQALETGKDDFLKPFRG
jgi:hypothetical protein